MAKQTKTSPARPGPELMKTIHVRGARVRTRLKRAIIALAVFGIPFAALAGSTQIVVQWLDGPNGLSAFQFFKLQVVLDDHAREHGYLSDGNDVGGGTTNFFLYADDKRVDEVVQSVVALEHQKQLPDGMQIGVAVYKDAARKDWTFRAVHPAGLQSFDLTYGKK